MNKNKLILGIAILIVIMPFLGIPNAFQDWLISILGLIVIVIIVLFNLSNKENKIQEEKVEQTELKFDEKPFVENQLMEISNEEVDLFQDKSEIKIEEEKNNNDKV